MSDFESPLPKKPKPVKTQKQVLEELDREWNFDSLIAPYEEGGKPDMPVKRTWGTMIDWLVNKRKFPPEVVGAAVFLTWMRIKRDGHFQPDLKPDGTPVYGSSGRKFAHAIAGMCASLMQQKVTGNVFSNMAGTIEDRIKVAFRNDMFLLMPWFVKVFSVQYWKHRNQKRKLKKAA